MPSNDALEDPQEEARCKGTEQLKPVELNIGDQKMAFSLFAPFPDRGMQFLMMLKYACNDIQTVYCPGSTQATVLISTKQANKLVDHNLNSAALSLCKNDDNYYTTPDSVREHAIIPPFGLRRPIHQTMACGAIQPCCTQNKRQHCTLITFARAMEFTSTNQMGKTARTGRFKEESNPMCLAADSNIQNGFPTPDYILDCHIMIDSVVPTDERGFHNSSGGNVTSTTILKDCVTADSNATKASALSDNSAERATTAPILRPPMLQPLNVSKPWWIVAVALNLLYPFKREPIRPLECNVINKERTEGHSDRGVDNQVGTSLITLLTALLQTIKPGIDNQTGKALYPSLIEGVCCGSQDH